MGTYELSRSFVFESAHTLQRESVVPDAANGSRRIHGHSYRATVTIAGEPDLASGMLLDLDFFAQALSTVKDTLDHRLLDEVTGLGPSTLESLSRFIWRSLAPGLPGLHRVSVSRDMTGEACSYTEVLP